MRPANVVIGSQTPLLNLRGDIAAWYITPPFSQQAEGGGAAGNELFTKISENAEISLTISRKVNEYD